MAAKWGSWRDIQRADFDERDYFGIYEIRMIDRGGRPITISRIGGIDKEGVIYIGRSGHKGQRTLAQRIREFQRGTHSGAETYRLMRNNSEYLKHAYSGHRLQYQTMHLQADEVKIDDQEGAALLKEFYYRNKIQKEEVDALAHYFVKYGELPPCNSNFPKWESFTKRVQEIGMSERS